GWINPSAHQLAVVFGDRDDVTEFFYDLALVAPHLGVFDAVDELLNRICLGGGVATPDFALDVVLKEDGGNREILGKIHGGVEKIADGDVEGPIVVPIFDSCLHARRGESADCVRCGFQEMQRVAECIRWSIARTQAHRIGEVLLQVVFVLRVGFAAVVREERQLVLSGEFPDEAKGTDISATVHRQKFIGFDPEDFQWTSPVFHTGLRPVTKLVKATRAAAFSTTKVHAAPAILPSGPAWTSGRSRRATR